MDRSRVLVSLLVVLPVIGCTQKEQVSSSSSTAVSSTVASTATTAPPPVVTTTIAPAPTTQAPPPAATETGIASAEGEQSGVTVVVKELKRNSGGMVSLKFSMTNNSDKGVGFGYDFGDLSHEIKDHGTVGGVQLVDPVGKKKYFVARDSEDQCVCSQKIHDISKGKSGNFWAKFPAPPEDVQKISVIIPHFVPMDDVPISK